MVELWPAPGITTSFDSLWNDLERKWKDFSDRAEMEQSAEGLGSAFSQLGGEFKQAYVRIRNALND